MKQAPPESPPLPFLAARLREQRRAVGLTVQGLAARIGASRNTITNYEAARTVPSSDQLVMLADALGCELLDLLAAGPPPAPVRLAFRAHKRLQEQGHWPVALRRFAQACQEIEALVGTGGGEPLPRYPLPQQGSESRPLIEAAAEQLRRLSRLPDLGAEHVVRALEALGCRVGFLPGERGLDGVSAEYAGMALIMLPNEAPIVERAIFRGAHELGHLVLHPELFDPATEEGTKTPPVAPGQAAAAQAKEPKQYEDEANHFAGCFLVPASELLGLWHGERLHRLPLLYALLLLKRHFRVSFWALYRRVVRLGLASTPYPQMVDQLKRHLDIQGRAHMEDLEPDPMPATSLDRDTRLSRLVCGAFLNGEISVAKVADLLQIDVEAARDLAHEWQKPRTTMVG